MKEYTKFKNRTKLDLLYSGREIELIWPEGSLVRALKILKHRKIRHELEAEKLGLF